MSALKYIYFENVGFVIFESMIEHARMAQMVGDTPVSAGFCTMPDRNGNGAECYGTSTSLNLPSSPTDTPRLRRKLNPFGA